LHRGELERQRRLGPLEGGEKGGSKYEASKLIAVKKKKQKGSRKPERG